MASTEAGLIIRQAADQGLKATLVSGDGIVSNELASIAGDAVAGTLNTFGPDPTLNPANKDLVAKFKAAGFNPEAYSFTPTPRCSRSLVEQRLPGRTMLKLLLLQ